MTKPIQPEPTQDGREIPRLLSLTVAPIVVEQRERGVAKKKKKERESVKKKEKKRKKGEGGEKKGKLARRLGTMKRLDLF